MSKIKQSVQEHLKYLGLKGKTV